VFFICVYSRSSAVEFLFSIFQDSRWAKPLFRFRKPIPNPPTRLETPRQLAARFERGEIDRTELQCKFFSSEVSIVLGSVCHSGFYPVVLITSLAK
jgi:hypothetical protein